MQNMHSPKPTNPLRVFTAAILNGVPVPETVRAVLEANGVNTYELEHRMLHQLTARAA
jgi:hypothetical protein